MSDDRPEPLDLPSIAATRFAVRRVARTGSTNADLLQAAAAGEPAGAVLMADHQTAGRGRRGRSWEAPPGASLLVSVLLRPTLPPEQSAVLTAAVALAARSACESRAGVTPSLKWPNDLVAPTPDGERKLGGILAESRLESGRLDAVVVGLGLNVDWPRELPPELASIATSLAHLTPGGSPPDRAALLADLLVDLEERLARVEAGDRAGLWADWREATSTLGRRVRVETGTSEIVGTAHDITELGRLVVDPDGESDPIEVDVGDVIHLRPA